ncbi:CST complex subunit TEN1 isoform X2 [Trichomycterus rosablanca]|uniref:CST complex subunit TEN1 isoform X2 n=1 Tax=Trichomycterus rosablanca TaxID=2290929 RepID=UPI002F350329
MLPAAAVFYFPWEIKTDLVKDGASLRTYGRLTSYQPEESKAILASHHASVQYLVTVQTTFVEPFNPIIGAQYIVLGEIEKPEDGGNRSTQRKRTRTLGEHANSTQKVPGPPHLGIEPRTFLL